jgi:hypothetical protein
MHQESSRGAGRVEGASLKTMVGAGRATAVEAIDRLEGLLGLLAARAGRAGQLTADAGVIRVVLRLSRWEDFARGCLDDSLARGFPAVWADTVTAGPG